jgi:NurA-like 5'-3' nuclease
MQDRLQQIFRILQGLTVREQVLSLSFIVVMLFIWAGSWLGRSEDWNDDRKATAASLAEQSLWIERGPTYAQSAREVMEQLDSSKTFGATQLSGRIDRLLREAGLSTTADIDPVKSKQGEIFNEHTLRVQLKRASIAQYVQFNNRLLQEAPYINQQSVLIKANRRNPEELDIRFEIASLELIPDSF